MQAFIACGDPTSWGNVQRQYKALLSTREDEAAAEADEAAASYVRPPQRMARGGASGGGGSAAGASAAASGISLAARSDLFVRCVLFCVTSLICLLHFASVSTPRLMPAGISTFGMIRTQLNRHLTRPCAARISC